MNKEFGLRERKKGILKLSLVEALMKELNDKHFDDIKVKDLCYAVNVSEVTFFKYFDRKEELLQYYLQVWNYDREVRIFTEGRKEGIDAIYTMFEDIAATPNVVAVLNTQAVFISRSKVKPEPIILTPCERWLINSDVTPTNPLGLTEQFLRHLQQAIEDGSMTDTKDLNDYIMLLSSLFYGGSLISHATGTPLKEHYLRSLDIIFNR